MSDLEDRVRATLSTHAAHSGPPPATSRPFLRRIRVSQFLVAITSLLGVVAVIVGSVIGVRAATSRLGSIEPAQQPTHESLAYILDYDRATENAIHQVRIGDDTISVLRTYATGADTQFDLSHDGTRIYAASRFGGYLESPEPSDVFTVFEVATGAVLDKEQLEFWPSHPVWQGSQEAPMVRDKIAASPDGNNVFLVVGFNESENRPQSIATYDVVAREMRPKLAPLEGCVEPTLLPQAGDALAVACALNNEVRFIRVAPSGATESESRVPLPGADRTIEDEYGNTVEVGYLADAVTSPDGRNIYVVTRDGHLFVLDTETGDVAETRRLEIPHDLLITGGQLAVSPNNDLLIVGFDEATDLALSPATALAAFRTSDFRRLGVVDVPEFTSLALGSVRDRVFLVNRDTASVYIANPEQESDVREAGQVGGEPVVIQRRPSS